jgi:hypothetical protein
MRTLLRQLAALSAACVALSTTMSGQVPNQPTDQAGDGRLNIFFDCHARYCDFSHFRREIAYVNWMRDRTDADVHILITSQRTGSGGDELTLAFIGLREFAGQETTLRYVVSADDTRDEGRDGLTRTIALGLVAYVAQTAEAPRLAVFYQPPAESHLVQQTEPDDPWDYWVFRLNVRGSMDGESQERFWSGNASVSASRVTDDLKLIFSARARGDRSEFDVVDTTIPLDTTYVSVRTSYSSTAYGVFSLTPHWSAGGIVDISRNSSVNLDLGIRGGPAIEYNIYPYSESTRRQFTFRYTPGLRSFDYVEETVYDKTSEVLPLHSFDVELDVRQPWGSVHGGLHASQYLHDLSKHNVRLDGYINFRVFRGLDFNMGGNISRIKDQLYLPKQDLTPEEVLLRVQSRQTDFRYGLNIGLSFRFGSKFNNVVNPRMW